MERFISDESTNLTVKEYLELMRGPQQISYEIVIPITVVYIIIFVTGVIGNVIVCLVIVRNTNFQTPTNYYLFSLAISDLLILLFGLPNDLKVYWQQYPWIFGETVCKLRAFVAEMTSYASVLTIVAFSTERYLAICHPLLIQTVSSLSRTIKILTTVWVTSCLCAIPFAVFTQVNYLFYPNGTGSYLQESAFCALPMDNNDISLPLVQFSSIVFFCVPMTLIVIIYVKIGLKVRKSRFSRLNSQNRMTSKLGNHSFEGSGDRSGRVKDSSFRETKQPARKSINRMLIAVVIAFFICWAPFHTQRLFACFFDPTEWTRALRQLNEILYYTGGCLYYFSATINPILYSLMSVRYREAFREALCVFGPKPERHLSNTMRYSHRLSDTRVVSEKNSIFHGESTAVVLTRSNEIERSSINGVHSSRPLPNQKMKDLNHQDHSNFLSNFSDFMCRICSRNKRVSKPVFDTKTPVPIIKITSSSPEGLKTTSNALLPTLQNCQTKPTNENGKSQVAKEKIRIFRETAV